MTITPLYKRISSIAISLLLLAVLAGLVGCADPITPPATAASTPPTAATSTATSEPVATSTPSPTAQAVYNPTFEPGPCSFDVPQGATVECGFVVVPEDHNNPTEASIQLATAIFRDQGDAHLPDPVVFLAGGPGEKTVHNAALLAQIFAPVHANRDLIIFDQRGVGLSEPALECPEAERAGFDLLDEPDRTVAAQVAYDAVMACRDRLVSEGHNLAAYTTAQNAADVDAIRIALGYNQVNLYGGSYGSLLAQATMRDYPAGIRSVVLESVFPVEVSFFLDTATTVPEAIVRLLDACADDDACNTAYPNLQDVLFEVIDRLNAEPLSVVLTNPRDGQGYDALLTGDAVLGILRAVLYQTPTIPAAPQAIYDLYNGDYALITQLASTRLAFTGALSLGMEYSMMCARDFVGRTPEELLEARAALPRQLGGSVDPALELKYGIFGICENWPVEQADLSAKEPVISDIPTLLLSGEYDPVTPPAFGRLVAKHLSNGHFYVLPGGGHTGESFGQCALSITAAFIGDPADAPDVSCIAEMPGLAFDLPVKAAEIVLEPYANPGMGISGLVPAGWTEVQPGTFARASSALDMAALQLAVASDIEVPALLADIAKGYGLAEMPAPIGERPANGLTWSLYTFEAQGVPRDLALVESEAGIVILVVRSAVDERDTLRERIFLPMVDALMPLAAETKATESASKAEIELVPFDSAAMGISGLVPTGWTEAGPGTYARASSASDITVLLLQAAPVSAQDLLATLSSQLGLSASPETTGERKANGLVWALYEVVIEDVFRDIALAERDGRAFIVILRTESSARDALYESVYLRAVDALVAVE